MRITVDQVGDVKRGKFGPYGTIYANGSAYSVDGDPGELLDKTLDVEIQTKTARSGRSYKKAKILKILNPDELPQKPPLGASSNGSTRSSQERPPKTKWAMYRAFVLHAHKFSKELEPEDSPARLGVFTAIIEAFGRGDFEIEP